jgi:hypothetical protein
LEETSVKNMDETNHKEEAEQLQKEQQQEEIANGLHGELDEKGEVLE